MANQHAKLTEVTGNVQVVTGPGVIVSMSVSATAEVDFHDGTSAAGTKIGTILFGVAAHTETFPPNYMPEFSTGLWAEVIAGACKVYTA